MGDTIHLKAYAKINLGLDVLRRREDGYHEVKMIMQTVTLHDDLELRRTSEAGIRVENNLPYLPKNENNLAYRAAKILMDEFDIRDGMEIRLNKRIPVAAGMAGGSSDCAAVLWGMNLMYGLGLSMEELMARGVRLGADVPYCLLRGTALAEGIGEKLKPLAPMPRCMLLIARPNINVSTRFVYENLHVDELRPEQHPDVDALVGALERKDLLFLASHMGNVLAGVTEPLHPVIGSIRQCMMENGALGALMSGSGPTVFGIYKTRAAVSSAYVALKNSGLAKQVFTAAPYNIHKRRM
ncbi:MAG: 4-(cytidine 5'-diphospho)-2-C-methyl-D-erythritol kinase [Lachnospiraceae bacterium]|nr:4-(cytidine 5'-diphospho)-2-C-methyl-D-erythritol kinase [Lachnospiraceae bacterium]